MHFKKWWMILLGLIPIGFGLGVHQHEVFAENKEIITSDYTVQIPTSVEITRGGGRHY